MANETYTLIQKTTLTAAASSITLSSIPQTFTDLVVKVSARTTYASPYGEGIYLSFNGLNTNMTRRRLYGLATGSGGSDNAANSYAAYTSAASQTADTFGSSELYIPNYTSSNFKSSSLDAVAENNASTAAMLLNANLWSASAAITSITLTPETGSNFVQYTTVSLYGVAKYGVTPVAGPKATGGDIITNDGTYWIHQFLNSGTFTPSQTLSTEYLVVAGGGGGGNYIGGGGGAGGYRTNVGSTALSATAQSYTITVGAGGTGGSGASTLPTSGGVSTFSTVSSSGGGGGGGYNGSWQVGIAGGSGGGGGVGSLAGGAGNSGSYSPVEGYAGGAGSANVGGNSTAGGGGGASVVGSVAVSNVPGNGGNGLASSITGTSVTRAGGGGGGAHVTYSVLSSGGTGGGGAGGYSSANGTAGTTNLGAGGGGAGVNYTGGAGGSGIVIIRYAM